MGIIPGGTLCCILLAVITIAPIAITLPRDALRPLRCICAAVHCLMHCSSSLIGLRTYLAANCTTCNEHLYIACSIVWSSVCHKPAHIAEMQEGLVWCETCSQQ